MRPLGIFAPWRLCAYGGILAVLYGMLLLLFYRAGIWLVNREGIPLYSDFILPWLVAVQRCTDNSPRFMIPSSS